MGRLRIWAVVMLAAVMLGCDGYKVVRVSGWNTRSKVAANTYTLRRVNGNDYWTSLMFSPNSPTSALYIPNYAYYQGLIYTPKGLSVIGQVRIIGGAAARASVALRDGAMVTTNPEAFQDRVQPTRFRYQITNWKEVP
ncbi:hypothetical protein IV102_36710 [bacterium]|nr:hypothetical protein [bacterium]